MQYIAIALVWAAFVALCLAAKKRRRGFTLLFLVTTLLAVLALAAWGVFRNF